MIWYIFIYTNTFHSYNCVCLSAFLYAHVAFPLDSLRRRADALARRTPNATAAFWSRRIKISLHIHVSMLLCMCGVCMCVFECTFQLACSVIRCQQQKLDCHYASLLNGKLYNFNILLHFALWGRRCRFCHGDIMPLRMLANKK